MMESKTLVVTALATVMVLSSFVYFFPSAQSVPTVSNRRPVRLRPLAIGILLGGVLTSISLRRCRSAAAFSAGVSASLACMPLMTSSPASSAPRRCGSQLSTIFPPMFATPITIERAPDALGEDLGDVGSGEGVLIEAYFRSVIPLENHDGTGGRGGYQAVEDAVGGGFTVREEAHDGHEVRLGGLAEKVAKEIQARTGKETRSIVLGHLQRGGQPTPADRLLATRFGAAAVRAIERGQYNVMVAYQSSTIVPVPLEIAVKNRKQVPLDYDVIQSARDLGISFGDQ